MKRLTILFALFAGIQAYAQPQNEVRDYYSGVTEIVLGEDAYFVHEMEPVRGIPSRWPHSFTFYNKQNMPGGTSPVDRRTGKVIPPPVPGISIDQDAVCEVFNELFPGCRYQMTLYQMKEADAVMRLNVSVKIDPVSMAVIESGIGVGTTPEYKQVVYSLPPSYFSRLEHLVKEKVRGVSRFPEEFYSEKILPASFVAADWTIYISAQDLMSEEWQRVFRQR